MSSDPLTDIIPMMRRPSDGQIITQFEYPTCETLGLLKMDFLGLRNLTVLSDAVANIESNGKEPVDLESLPFDDEKTYELLQRGDTLGVFQLDGSGMRTLLRQMKPDKFGDITAVSALYRPGPHGYGLPHQLCAAQERAAADHADPSRARGAARGDPRRDVRRARLPGAGHADRAEGRGIQPRRGRHPPARHGKEEEGGAGQAVRVLRGRHEGARLLRRRGRGPVGDPAPVRRLRLQQVPLGRLRRGLLLDRLSQGELSDGVHGGAADLHPGEPRSSRPVPR